jgi:glycosyltransferase involved in cell wall biosynthesis
MRIGFNAYFLGQQSTGSGQYAGHLLRELSQVDRHNQYMLCAPEELRLAPAARFEPRVLRPPLAGRARNLGKLWFEQVSFPRACAGALADVVHVPYCAAPIVRPGPTVVTVHDLIPLLLPAYRRSFLARLYTTLVMASARRADVVVTDSEHSRRDIAKHLGLSLGKIRVIQLAADPSHRPVNDENRLSAIRRKYGLPDEFLLYLGGFDQRKNARGLLQAYARLLELLPMRAPPLVIGGRLPDSPSTLFPDPKRIVADLRLEERVHFVGWIAEEDKPAVYSAALFFVFLSLYEGFGLEPLEAMACGTPVLVSQEASLPEVVGSGGLLVDPTDRDQVAEGMAALAQDASLRQKLAVQGLAQARRFTWRRTAQEMLEVYRHAAA